MRKFESCGCLETSTRLCGRQFLSSPSTPLLHVRTVHRPFYRENESITLLHAHHTPYPHPHLHFQPFDSLTSSWPSVLWAPEYLALSTPSDFWMSRIFSQGCMEWNWTRRYCIASPLPSLTESGVTSDSNFFFSFRIIISNFYLLWLYRVGLDGAHVLVPAGQGFNLFFLLFFFFFKGKLIPGNQTGYS